MSAGAAAGCFESHGRIGGRDASMADEALQLLDDCFDFLAEALDQPAPREWDAFCGGCTASDPPDPHDSDIIATYFLGLSAQAAETLNPYLERFTQLDYTPEQRAASKSDFESQLSLRNQRRRRLVPLRLHGIQDRICPDCFAATVAHRCWAQPLVQQCSCIAQLRRLARRVRNALRGAPSWNAQKHILFGSGKPAR